MRKFFSSLCILSALFSPALASAHALPTAYEPDASSALSHAPGQVSIHFSERLDPAGTSLTVKGPSGAVVSQGMSIDAARVVASVPLTSEGNGTYVVSWSAVSADDGHFTKGGFAFSVGNATAATGSEGVADVVTPSDVPEAVSSALGLVGFGLMLAALLLFFIVRGESAEDRFLRRLLIAAGISGALASVCGAFLELFVRAGEFGLLRESAEPFIESVRQYAGTGAGAATLWRFAAGLVAGVLFVLLRIRRISFFVTGLLALDLIAFAYFRAAVSHVLEAPLPRLLSLFVNIVHLGATDLWAGMPIVLLLMLAFPRVRIAVRDLLPRALGALSLALAIISLTGSYIVWVLLKDPANLFTTEWGTRCISLVLIAALLWSAFLIFAWLYRRSPAAFSRYSPPLLGGMGALGIALVYASSLLIITSPPPTHPPAPIYAAAENGVHIELGRDFEEDGMLLLTASGSVRDRISEPTVVITDAASRNLSAGLFKRFEGGYVFPASLLVGAGPFEVSITVPHEAGYDAHATFSVPSGAFEPPSGWSTKPRIDLFALAVFALALSGCALGVALYRNFRRRLQIPLPESAALMHGLGGIGVGAAAALLLTLLGTSNLLNPFKAQCEADGNMWHLMQPSKAGVPLALASQEGCMWGMGNFPYQFGDKREYDYYRALPHATVNFSHLPEQLAAGSLATLTFSITQPDGTPAPLFIDMEKYLHIVIVSEDETVFAHIHPDDIHPLSPEDIRASTFTARYTFPKAGKYLVSADYANGMALESKQFIVEVAGASGQASRPAIYRSPGTFGGYTVSLDYDLPLAGEVSTLRFTIMKDGKPVEDLEPYLAGAMHISTVKNDLSTFIHTHGEVHLPGLPLPPIIVKNGQVLHSMQNMITPARFGPTVETHLIFPLPGLYTVWGQFKAEGRVIPASFTVQVE